MFEALAVIAICVFIVWCIALNNNKRIRDLEDKIDQTKCVLLHPERVDSYCPEGQKKHHVVPLPTFEVSE
jgi:hypothetical protein